MPMPIAAQSPTAETRDLRDEIESRLDNWDWGLRGDLEEERSTVPRAYGSGALKAMYVFDSEALSLIPVVRRACREASKPALESINAALRLGLLMGLSQMQPYLYHHDRYRYEIRPDVERGQKVRRAASLGGKARWRAQDNEGRERERRERERRERAIEQVRQLHATNPRRSRHDICQQVGTGLGRSWRTIWRHTLSVDW